MVSQYWEKLCLEIERCVREQNRDKDRTGLSPDSIVILQRGKRLSESKCLKEMFCLGILPELMKERGTQSFCHGLKVKCPFQTKVLKHFVSISWGCLERFGTFGK